MLNLYIILLTLGIIHVGYIFLAIIYPKKEDEYQPPDRKYSIEHIICFKNESKFIKEKLKNCYEIDYPFLHHTFVNDNSTDDTLAILEKYRQTDTDIISNAQDVGKNRSQIKAVNRSSSDLVLFTDANVFLEKNALNALIRYFDDENIGGVCGDVTTTTDMKHQEISGRYWEVEKNIKRFQSLFGAVIGFDGGFYCVKTAYYKLRKENELSDFETAFLIFKQGKAIKYAKDASAVELERRKLTDSFKARIRASNRVFWSFRRIFKYINALKLSVLVHFTLHKLLRYLFVITFILSLPSIVIDLYRISPFLLLIFWVPYIYRFVIESIALSIGGVIALTGYEYKIWSNKKDHRL
jgi:cellulose synthase/poly-beta-1,6-N-acetylglucosamine synthase-like glycosyltransferase